MLKITKRTGEGYGSCKRREALQERIMNLIPETIDTDTGTHIYLLHQERLKIAKAVTDGLIHEFEEEVYGKAQKI